MNTIIKLSPLYKDLIFINASSVSPKETRKAFGGKDKCEASQIDVTTIA